MRAVKEYNNKTLMGRTVQVNSYLLCHTLLQWFSNTACICWMAGMHCSIAQFLILLFQSAILHGKAKQAPDNIASHVNP